MVFCAPSQNEDLDSDTASSSDAQSAIKGLSNKINSLRVSIAKKLQDFAADYDDGTGSISSLGQNASTTENANAVPNDRKNSWATRSSEDEQPTNAVPNNRKNSWVSLGGYGLKFGSVFDKDSVSIAVFYREQWRCSAVSIHFLK